MEGMFLTYMADPGGNEFKLIKVRVNWSLRDLDNEFTRSYRNCVEWSIDHEVDLEPDGKWGIHTHWERMGDMLHTWTNRATETEIKELLRTKVERIGMISNDKTWRDIIGLNSFSGPGAHYSFMAAQRFNKLIDYDSILREVTLRHNIIYDGDNAIHWKEAAEEVVKQTQVNIQ